MRLDHQFLMINLHLIIIINYHYFDKNISITILYFYNLNKFTISNYQNKFYIYFY